MDRGPQFIYWGTSGIQNWMHMMGSIKHNGLMPFLGLPKPTLLTHVYHVNVNIMGALSSMQNGGFSTFGVFFRILAQACRKYRQLIR